MKGAGLIPAAGGSRRMDGFKPLLKINGFPMITMTVQSLRNAGIRDIIVVTGYRGEEVEKVLEPMGVRIIENRRWQETDMLASVKLGLEAADKKEGVYILPGDIPVTPPGTFKKMAEGISKAKPGTEVLLPGAGGKILHPPFLFPEGCRQALDYQGSKGLRGAFGSMETEIVTAADTGAEMDADNRKDLAQIQDYARKHRGISRELCEGLYDEVSLPAHIRAHCLAVGEMAAWMAKRLISAGAFLDMELCRSGGYLHDLLRLEPFHEKAGKKFLEEKGYLALAAVVGAHRGFEQEPVTLCSEAVLVCLADKLIMEDRRVSLEERYRKALEKKEVKKRILRDIEICRRLIKEFEVMTGERL